MILKLDLVPISYDWILPQVLLYKLGDEVDSMEEGKTLEKVKEQLKPDAHDKKREGEEHETTNECNTVAADWEAERQGLNSITRFA